MSSFVYDGLVSGTSEDANYIALGGGDRQVEVIPFDLPASTADLAVTGAGFQPECVVIFGCVTFAADSSFDGLFLHYGVASDPTEQWAMCAWGGDNSAGNERNAGWSESHIIYQSTSGSVVDFACSLQSFDADGFTLNVDDAPGIGLAMVAVCMRGGGSYKAGTDTVPVAAGSQLIDAGFVAECILFGSTCRVSDPEISANYSLSIGAADDTRQNCDAISADSGSWFTTTRLDRIHSLLLTRTDPSGGVVLAEAELIDLDNAGEFELDWQTVDGNAYRFGYLALENAAMDWFTAVAIGAPGTIVTTPIPAKGLLTFQTTAYPSLAPGTDPGVPDVNGWIPGASIGVSAVPTNVATERSASVQDASSPPFFVIQTRRHLAIGSFGCFRHAEGGLIIGTDSSMAHLLDVVEFVGAVVAWVPQIYRRVVQR